MFWKSKEKILRKKIDVNINEHNAAWLLNEELKRLHGLLKDAVNTTGGAHNAKIWWNKIEQLQNKMVEYVAKAPDHDLQKSVLDIQSDLVDKIVLGEGDGKEKT